MLALCTAPLPTLLGAQPQRGEALIRGNRLCPEIICLRNAPRGDLASLQPEEQIASIFQFVLLCSTNISQVLAVPGPDLCSAHVPRLPGPSQLPISPRGKLISRAALPVCHLRPFLIGLALQCWGGRNFLAENTTGVPLGWVLTGLACTLSVLHPGPLKKVPGNRHFLCTCHIAGPRLGP